MPHYIFEIHNSLLTRGSLNKTLYCKGNKLYRSRWMMHAVKIENKRVMCMVFLRKRKITIDRDENGKLMLN
jgi:hypothetical protein